MQHQNIFLFFAASLVLASACAPKGFPQGERLYTYHCANCHMDDGSGLEGLIPPLAGSDFLAAYPAEVPCIIRYGVKKEIEVKGKTYEQEMAGIPELNEYEITNIINYIHHAWGNELGYRNPEEVKSALENCESGPSSENGG
ncbi:MAG: cytochrome c [Saprospirales bacterium]|nr:cytochrome c [Saprospirales bacterium]MBK6904317.1 cytochrome c [Saprospirales bacterium]MBK7336544.1 cytochrome c [Saprospirales bacterium]